METRIIRCIDCGAEKKILVSRRLYIEQVVIVQFQLDGWVYLQGTRGICSACPKRMVKPTLPEYARV